MAAVDRDVCHPKGAAAAVPHRLAVARENHLEVFLDVLAQRELAVAGRLWFLLACPGTNQGVACDPVVIAVYHWQQVKAFDLRAL